MTLVFVITLLVTLALVVTLYLEWVNPAIAFSAAALILTGFGIITLEELLKGFSNTQIIIIFLLLLVTAGIRSIFGTRFFNSAFPLHLTPRAFLMRMMLSVSAVSAFLNNTPIVAFLMPYVRDWSRRTGNSPARFLIPLSYAAILGGMVTVIGTSTNMVLDGLIRQYDLPLLAFTDFLYLGLLVTGLGLLYMFFIGHRLLPDQITTGDPPALNPRDYLIESIVPANSKLSGKKVSETDLLHADEVLLVEIIRGNEMITPVSPEEKICSGDLFYFSGNREAVVTMINHQNGLELHDSGRSGDRVRLFEAVVPASSDLVGARINASGFLERYDAGIIAIHRNGKRVSGRISDMELASGDFLLLVTAEAQRVRGDGGLLLLEVEPELEVSQEGWRKLIGAFGFAILLAGIVGLIPLFYASIFILVMFVISRILRFPEIRASLDVGLLMVLVSSLALGTALERSGAAQWIAGLMISSAQSMGIVAAVTLLFIGTTLLTAFVSNVATIAIVFPVAMSMAAQLHSPTTPFFVAIAFAASGDFATPFGYQTNLMVYGPGGYRFRDFLRVGLPLTLIYMVICITFISIKYSLL